MEKIIKVFVMIFIVTFLFCLFCLFPCWALHPYNDNVEEPNYLIFTDWDNEGVEDPAKRIEGVDV